MHRSAGVGMFCVFGFPDDSRPVAVPACLKSVCRRYSESTRSSHPSKYVPQK